VTAYHVGEVCTWDNRPTTVRSFGYYNTADSVEVNWRPPYAGTVQEYRIYLAQGDTPESDSAPLSLVGSAAPTTEVFQTFTITGLSPWKRYCFAVSTIDQMGVESLKDKSCSATIGIAPTL
jgi:hypothetical protein